MSALLFFLFLAFNLLHPIHLSVTNIEFNTKNKNFDISIRLFTDDFEKILDTKYNVILNLGKENENSKADWYINQYIISHLQLFFDHKKVENKHFVLKKKEFKDNTIWLYYKIKYGKNLKTVKIINTLMTDLYADQKNLLIFTYKNVQKALEFNSRDIENQFNIN